MFVDLDISESLVLIVDDDPVVTRILGKIISGLCRYHIVHSGREAIDYCLGYRVDLVLLDFKMGQMDGIKTCKLFKSIADLEDIPIVFVTGMDNPQTELQCWEAGAKDFVTKPVNPPTLHHRIRNHLVSKKLEDYLQELSFKDGLTGISNRRALDEAIARMARQGRRTNKPLSILMLDVDFFKLYNDIYGHLAGDDCLKILARTIKDSSQRPLDFTYRYGGEEFLLLLEDTSEKGASIVAERILSGVRALNLPHEGSPYGRVSVSIGIALADLGDDTLLPEDWIKCADAALYRAKAAGRNTFCLYQEAECEIKKA